ncbi:flagellar hook protein FlgE [Sulfurimonas hydrogeniphila]|uniref:flagellar hook protein FlgE n=1 Tax=Sulfurimonas TaxID=202746 RepID=UPI00125F23BC|nr:flagellar hook-basal body complex protein [Sulfurimonas hydrogeniphila]
MMTQAFYTGLSGLKTNSSGIDIISDNLANVNTVGYRGNTYEFSSLFEDALMTTNGTTSDSVGLGTTLQATPMIESTGSYLLTDRSTDLAILGDGWFGVQGDGDPVYTRNGAFSFDSNDDLVTTDGYHVLGTMGGNIDGEVLTQQLDEVPLADAGEQEKLRFPKSLTYPAEPTTIAQFSGNIGTVSEVRTMSASVVDPAGVKNELKLEYTLVDPQIPPGTQWNVVATTQSLDGETIYDTQSGIVEFDETGALVTNTLTSIDNNGASVTIDLGTGFDGIVALSNVDITASSLSNGTIGGELNGYDINKNGEVIATFTNGMQSSVGKIALYHFQNDQGLSRLSGTNFAQSSNSGEAFFYKDAAGQNVIGTDMTNYKLEGSNVDMTYGLTELIVLQRSYDANSKSITTADEMMQKALDMDA